LPGRLTPDFLGPPGDFDFGTILDFSHSLFGIFSETSRRLTETVNFGLSPLGSVHCGSLRFTFTLLPQTPSKANNCQDLDFNLVPILITNFFSKFFDLFHRSLDRGSSADRLSSNGHVVQIGSMIKPFGLCMGIAIEYYNSTVTTDLFVHMI
jgi:hypothetical protein